MKNQFKNDFIRKTGRMTKQWGLGESVGKIWGLLLFENKPLTQREIASHLDCAVSLVSPSLNLMENLGLVSIIGKNGREKQYGSVQSFISVFEKLVKNFIEKEVNPLIKLINNNMNRIEEKETKQRFENMLTEYKKAGESIQMLSRFIKINGGTKNDN